jgi:hypothetical protein
MGTHHNFFVVDEHLGILNGRSGEQEAEHIQNILHENGFVIVKEPKYIEEARCICFELRNAPIDKVADALNYDAVYSLRECSHILERIK